MEMGRVHGAETGMVPGRVIWVRDPASVSWDGTGYWWEPSHFDGTAVQRMVDEGIAALVGEADAAGGWNALFRAHNGGAAYSAGEKLAIKVNMNGCGVFDNDTSGKTKLGYTNPVLLKALLTSLVQEAGVSPEDIIVYDVARLFPDYMVKLCTEKVLRGVRFVGRNNGVADKNVPIVWSHSFGGAESFLPTCVTESTYLINLANLKGHYYGVTLCAKNHFGSFLNGNAMRPPEEAKLHQWLTTAKTGIYSPLVDLMGNYQLGAKTMLYLLDALICAPSEGDEITKENAAWQQAPFNGSFTASLFASQDPVAIDSVGLDFLQNEPAVIRENRVVTRESAENYLHEAARVEAAPSGTVYYDGSGKPLRYLGVHEHWNDAARKQYSRNLGKEEGIELVRVGVSF